jgi:hypothetical protein
MLEKLELGAINVQLKTGGNRPRRRQEA